MNIIYAQILGFIAMVLNIFSIQYKKKKNIMTMQLISNTLYTIQYWLLNAFSASYTTIIAIFRCILFRKYSNRKKAPIYLVSLLIISALAVGYFTYDGLLSLLPILICILYILGANSNKTKIFKIIYLICAVMWMYYNFKVKAYICLFGNVLEIISSIIALKKYKK